ncbi:DUF3883 domain-containing protein [Flavobacterium sp. KJJ]|uniref:DUF3883 domain-containing protein n=1 Tax=Flavobacterium sp. KJJ TaxID=1270193 RepID=UPI000493619F|nr:DUF3883 domain-containing protein [Flavobacterium sp. KJJ]
MDRERKLAHIVAYYFSRFDKEALENLGYKSDKEAWNKIGVALNVKYNYIKFRRDEFDVVHPHRLGWHKRPMSLSIIRTLDAFENFDEVTLRLLVQDIINNAHNPNFDLEMEVLSSVLPSDSEKKKRKVGAYTTRGITGKKAEDEFVWQLTTKKIQFPEDVEIKNVTNEGCGYDFKLIGKTTKYYVEVKGMSSVSGGISFTNKEWETARKKGDKYYVAIVTNIENEPQIRLIKNPAEQINPIRNIFSIIQINWSVSEKSLKNIAT